MHFAFAGGPRAIIAALFAGLNICFVVFAQQPLAYCRRRLAFVRGQAGVGREIPPKKGVTLYLDAALVDRFKRMTGGRGYRTLINEALQSSVQQADMAETLRQVVREETRTQKAA